MSAVSTMTAVDGRDALFGLIFKPGPGRTVTTETFGSGMSRREAAYMLRKVADALDGRGDAAGEPALPAGAGS